MGRKTVYFAVLLGLFLPTGLRAAETVLFSKGYFRRVGWDIAALPGSVGRASGKHLLLAGGVVGLTMAAYSFDAESREEFGGSNGNDRFSDVSASVKHFGDYKNIAPIIAGSWIGGLATGSPVLHKIAADGFEANLIAAGLITPGLKLLVGRSRPNHQSSSRDINPFSGASSFPSGHTTGAFAMAAVIDAALRPKFGYWQTPLLFSAAALTGASRVYDQKHHPSDVVVGAAIGTAVGYWVSGRARRRDRDLRVEWGVSDARLTYRF